VVLPKTAEEAISLTVERGFKTFGDLEHKLILPTVRNVLTLTANLMSARESYSDRRADFVFWARDQIASGLYETEGVTKKEKDPITGEVVTKVIKVIKMGPDGKPVRHVNPLAGTGITIDNFEIDRFFYDTKVNAQIEKQQQAFMDVQTAIVNAQKAEQDRLTAEAKGKADVMTSRYAEETKKAQEVVKAQKDKEVAEIKAAQELQVAKLMAQAAEQKKLAEILIAEGEAQAKRLKREADNYEALKIQAATEIHKYWAQAYANRRVPLVAGGFEEKSGEAQSGGMGVPKGLIDLLVLKALGINIDLGQRPPQAPQPQTK
jgi:regulator of protease activity HflC (stomatin/prohibitin superfamily)